jgi:hypothetical protein
MNKYIKTLISKNNEDLIQLQKIKKNNIMNLIKYSVSIKYNYPLLNYEEKSNLNYNKLYFSYIKNKCPEYYFTLLELNKNGIHFSNFYSKIGGWYFNCDEETLYDVVILFYINKCNENIIDKKINELQHKFEINKITIEKKDTYINIYDVKENGILFLTQDPFELSKNLFIYIYGICEETNSYVSLSSYSFNPVMKYKKSFISYYEYFTSKLINYEEPYKKRNNFNLITHGYNNFCFIDKSFIEINNLGYEFKLLKIIELTDLPNNVKIFLKKIKYKSFNILLYPEVGCININTIYKFINYSKLNEFFIIKENILIKNEPRIKIISSNIQYDPLKIECGEIKEFL